VSEEDKPSVSTQWSLKDNIIKVGKILIWFIINNIRVCLPHFHVEKIDDIITAIRLQQ